MRYMASSAIVLMSISLLGSPALSAPLDQFCAARGVLPAEGIGGVSLGDSFVDTIHRLGQPVEMLVRHAEDASDPRVPAQRITRPENGTMGHAYARFGGPMHLLEIRATDNRIDGITIADFPDCSDPHGIHAGSPGSSVIDQYGSSYSMLRAPKAISVVYNAMGIHFALKPTESGLGPVYAISVFLPNQFCKAAGRLLCDHYEPRLQ